MERYTILVADDDPDLRESMRVTLDREGHRVFTASCGLEAVAIVRSKPKRIHASILDMNMPDLTGLETLEAIFRCVERHPAIFITAHESKELLLKAMEAGAYTLLRKPLSTGLVVVTLNQLLDKFYGA
jgi:DNA-binding NtrC family response regulator